MSTAGPVLEDYEPRVEHVGTDELQTATGVTGEDRLPPGAPEHERKDHEAKPSSRPKYPK